MDGPASAFVDAGTGVYTSSQFRVTNGIQKHTHTATGASFSFRGRFLAGLSMVVEVRLALSGRVFRGRDPASWKEKDSDYAAG